MARTDKLWIDPASAFVRADLVHVPAAAGESNAVPAFAVTPIFVADHATHAFGTEKVGHFPMRWHAATRRHHKMYVRFHARRREEPIRRRQLDALFLQVFQ